MPIWGADEAVEELYVSGFFFKVREIVKSYSQSMFNALSMLAVAFPSYIELSGESEVSSESLWRKYFLFQCLFGWIPNNCASQFSSEDLSQVPIDAPVLAASQPDFFVVKPSPYEGMFSTLVQMGSLILSSPPKITTKSGKTRTF